MQDSDGSRARESSAAARTSWLKKALLWFVGGLLILLVAAIFLPVLDGPHSRERANESSAAAEIRTLNEAQQRYALSHSSGFACQLSELKLQNTGTDPADSYDGRFFKTGMRSGYLFAVVCCARDPKGKVTQYQITALPQQPGKTGNRAFCSDQSGVIRLENGGSASKCLLEGTPIAD